MSVPGEDGDGFPSHKLLLRRHMEAGPGTAARDMSQEPHLFANREEEWG